MAFVNQIEIDEFINRAKQKVADLGLDIAESSRDGEDHYKAEIKLSKELERLVTSLESFHLDWKEIDVLRYIHYYNEKAGLFVYPLVVFSEFDPKVEGEEVVDNDFATNTALNAEIANRISGDSTLQDQIDTINTTIAGLDFTAELDAALVDYALLTDLHSHANKTDLDNITTAMVTDLGNLSAHYADNVIHVDQAFRDDVLAKLDSISSANASITIDNTDPENPVLTYVQQDIAQSQVTALESRLTTIETDIAAIDPSDGQTPVVAIGTVSTLAAGSSATVVDSNADPVDVTLDFGIPEGDKGDKGDPFSVDKFGLDNGRFDSEFNGTTDSAGITIDDNYAYYATDTNLVYYRITGGPHPFPNSALTSAGWSVGIPFQGDSGWSPELRLEEVGPSKVVMKLVDWIGGEGVKPTTPTLPAYLGNGQFVSNAVSGINIKGVAGTQGDRGIFKIDASGTLAGRAAHDSEAEGFTYLQTDITPSVIYQKNTTTSGDWNGPFEWQGASSGIDSNAIHNNVSAEIAAVTEKLIPIAADLILIEDSAASNAKKRIQLGNMPFADESLTITTGRGLVGGGDLTVNRTFHVDIASEMEGVALDDDFLLLESNGGGTLKKTQVTNMPFVDEALILTAGNGLSGGGDLTTGRTFNVDINGQTENASPASNDWVIVENNVGGIFRKVQLSNLPGVGSDTPWTVNHDAAGFNLTDVGTVQADTFEVINSGAGANPTLVSNSTTQQLDINGSLFIIGQNTVFLEDGAAATITNGLDLQRRTTATAADGIGMRMTMGIENAVDQLVSNALNIEGKLTDVSDGIETSEMSITGILDGSITNFALINEFNTAIGLGYTIDGSATDRNTLLGAFTKAGANAADGIAIGAYVTTNADKAYIIGNSEGGEVVNDISESLRVAFPSGAGWTDISANISTNTGNFVMAKSIALLDNEAYLIKAEIIGFETTDPMDERAQYHIQGFFHRDGAGVVQDGTTQNITTPEETTASMDADFNINGNNVEVRVKGVDTVNMSWSMKISILHRDI